MIQDARVLQPEFIPREVKHRDGEVNHLSAALRPLIDGLPADPAFLYGPSGVGKTCIAQFTVERLRENVVEMNHQYVNCWEDHGRYKTLYAILEGIGQTVDIHRQSTPKDVLLDRIRSYDGSPYVVILDEVDHLGDKDPLYDLHRIPGLTMILMANMRRGCLRHWTIGMRVGSLTASEFASTATVTTNSAQFCRIASGGLNENVIDESGLRTITNNTFGDARAVIGVLRKSAHAGRTESRKSQTTLFGKRFRKRKPRSSRNPMIVSPLIKSLYLGSWMNTASLGRVIYTMSTVNG